MELRTKNCGENSCNCCPSSSPPKSYDTTPACSSDLFMHSPPAVSSSHYSPSLHRDAPLGGNITGDFGRIGGIPLSSQSNQDLQDAERKNCVPQADHLQVSPETLSDRIQATDAVSLEIQRRNHAPMRRKIAGRNSTLFSASRKSCSVTAKHLRSVFMRKHGIVFAQNVSHKSLVSMDKCSTDSRLSSSSLIDRISNTESLTECRSLKNDRTAESPSHLADLGHTANDSERTTPSHSPHNDGAIACNKAHSLLSVHSLCRDKELSFNGNLALRSSLQPSSVIKNSQRDPLDVAPWHQERPSIIIPSSFASSAAHGRLSKEPEVCPDAPSPRSFDLIESCKKKYVARKDKERKFRTSGRRKLKRRRREYGRLRDMVPSLKAQPAVSKVTLIEEAVKYIEELHGALIQRFRARGLPPTLAGSGLDRSDVGEGNIRDLVVQLLTKCNPGCLPPTRLENNRTKLKLQVSRPKVFDRRS